MAHKKGIEALNRTLQDIRGCNQIMGGLTVCPVTLDRPYLLYYEEHQQISSRPVLRHPFYDLISKLYLQELICAFICKMMRAEIFSKLLIDIGDGKIKEMEGRINIPESLGFDNLD
ncbi:hypothetical protein TNCV_1232791 [Trichonephila clavipes]|nr:hypothetical protein TNCV_1232791 [Trichonephila clavipes]